MNSIFVVIHVGKDNNNWLTSDVIAVNVLIVNHYSEEGTRQMIPMSTLYFILWDKLVILTEVEVE